MAHMATAQRRGRWTEAKIAKQLSDLYYAAGDPGSYGGVEALYRRANEVGIPVSRKHVQDYLAKQVTYSIHKPARHTFGRNHTYVGHIDQQWQADLADMQKLVNENDGYRYILTCVDILSRYAWAVPVKSKSSKDMLVAVKKLAKLSGGRVPQRLQTDQGKEFFNADVSAFLRSKKIKHFASHSDKKAAVVERFNRTLKSRLWKYFTANNTRRYVDILQDVVHAYNNSPHRSIGMRPVDVDNEVAAEKAWMSLYYKANAKSPGKSPGEIPKWQRVRIVRWKGGFEKGYVPNWSREHFVVRKRAAHPRPVYKLWDASGEQVKGAFYPEEIQPMPRLTLQVEQVLRHRRRNNRREALVKWLGWPEKFNKWIPAESVARYQRPLAERARTILHG